MINIIFKEQCIHQWPKNLKQNIKITLKDQIQWKGNKIFVKEYFHVLLAGLREINKTQKNDYENKFIIYVWQLFLYY